MSTNKIIHTGDYSINSTVGNITISAGAGLVTVDGDLIVTGNLFQFDETYNPIFVLNANLTANDSPYSGNSGISVKRGSGTSTNLLWHETGEFAGDWTLSNAAGKIGYALTSYNIKIEKTTSEPVATGDYIAITGNTAGTGSSGLYVNNGASSDELVTTTSAIKYALIFG